MGLGLDLPLVASPEGTHIMVRAQPNARRVGILGVHDGALRIGVNAQPERGKANQAVAAVLAGALSIRPSEVVLTSGATDRRKRFLVVGLDPVAILDRLRRAFVADSANA